MVPDYPQGVGNEPKASALAEAESRVVRFASLVRDGRFSGAFLIIIVIIGIALAAATTFALNRSDPTPRFLLFVGLADLTYFIVLSGMIVWRLVTLIGDRRAHSAGAQLHLRLTGIFALVAMAPTIVVAVFATITLSVGFEQLFSEKVRSVVKNSLYTAEAYAREHRRSINGDVLAMANDLNRVGAVGQNAKFLGEHLRHQQALKRFPEAYLIDGAQTILQRGDFSYTFTYDPPGEFQLSRARRGEVVIFEDKENNELRALVHLNSLVDTFLYVSREIDGEVLLLLDETAETVRLYQRAEASRERILSIFGLVYFGFALLVIVVAIWLGLWFAERLSRPIGVLAGAAQRVGDGDLDVQVPDGGQGDEVSLLGRVFNRMTAQVKQQRDELIEAHQESEQRLNFIETVLSGVSAGVIGLSSAGVVEMVNDAAQTMLSKEIEFGDDLTAIAPETAEVFNQACTSAARSAHAHIVVVIKGHEREFLVRVAARSSDIEQGYVMTLDDMTALAAAQREAAWGDVARRIAHEIKNPLTPIQLSAERMRRKFAKRVGEDQETFEQYADVIVRQAGDIRRMVDEFSRFARMPLPESGEHDLSKLLNDVVLMHQDSHSDVSVKVDGCDTAALCECDSTMITQAMTNIIKNAIESIETKLETSDQEAGNVAVSILRNGSIYEITVDDDGLGLPQAQRNNLTEPYVTTRKKKGTGLGLAIVKKIIEQHDGSLTLTDAPPTEDGGLGGARVVVKLPVAQSIQDKMI
ncbi:MAG: ATP-binding protein [Pikeienuella sp.]